MKPEIDVAGGTPPEETAATTVANTQGRFAGTASPRTGWWPGRLRPGPRWRFARHLLEMIVAMMVGMMMLGVAVGALGDPPGYSHPLVEYGYMGVSMSGAMVAWMRFRGHAWSDGLEMTAAMLLPMFAVVILFWLGASGETPGHALMMLAHVAMVGGMVALMTYRRGCYT